MTTATCPVCTNHKLAPGRTVCTPCIGRLRNRLIDLPGRMTDLEAALGRQLRFGSEYRHGGRNANTPLPYSPEASDAAYIARTTVLTWTDHIATAHGHPVPDTWRTIARYLSEHAPWLATIEEGPNAVDELLDALATATRAVDRPRYRKVPVHVACVQHTTTDQGERVPCPGGYYVLLDNDDTSQSHPDMICDQDPEHRITPLEWQRGMRRGDLNSAAARAFLATLRAGA